MVWTVGGTVMATVGSGDYVYEPVVDWAKLSAGWSFKEIGSVGVDKNDNVYVFNRGEHPMIVFDRDGNFLRSWGEGVFPRAHGVFMAPDDTIWLTDDGDHTVRQCTLEGKVLLTLGIPGKPAPYMSGEPFHRCTHTAMSPQGDMYVSDGYGNSRVHKFSPDGRLLLSWGAPGTDPGEFNIAHNITCDADGWVYVADRENHRVQGVRRQRPLRDAVEQSASAVRAVHAARQVPDLLYRRAWRGAAGQPQRAQSRAARDHRGSYRQTHRATGRDGPGHWSDGISRTTRADGRFARRHLRG